MTRRGCWRGRLDRDELDKWMRIIRFIRLHRSRCFVQSKNKLADVHTDGEWKETLEAANRTPASADFCARQTKQGICSCSLISLANPPSAHPRPSVIKLIDCRKGAEANLVSRTDRDRSRSIIGRSVRLFD